MLILILKLTCRQHSMIPFLWISNSDLRSFRIPNPLRHGRTDLRLIIVPKIYAINSWWWDWVWLLSTACCAQDHPHVLPLLRSGGSIGGCGRRTHATDRLRWSLQHGWLRDSPWVSLLFPSSLLAFHVSLFRQQNLQFGWEAQCAGLPGRVSRDWILRQTWKVSSSSRFIVIWPWYFQRVPVSPQGNGRLLWFGWQSGSDQLHPGQGTRGRLWYVPHGFSYSNPLLFSVSFELWNSIRVSLISGGYTTGPKAVIDLLRNRSRPYLFSNTLPPPVVACASKVCTLWS